MSVPLRDPVLVTVNVAVAVPCRDTSGVTDSPVVLYVVYDRPNPNGYSGLYAWPAPPPVPGSWSNTFGWSPIGDGALPLKSPPTASASEGQLIGNLPLGLMLPKTTSATAWPASVLPW